MGTAKLKLDRSFGWLNATQFLGALNDNVFKQLIILFLIYLQSKSDSSNITADASRIMVWAGVVFVIPFLLFSAVAGRLSDRFSKRDIVVLAKAAEVVIMIAGCIAFIFQSAIGLYVLLFVMAAQSTFFAPAKYGIIPELVGREQLSKANSFLEALTYLAIIIGAAVGPFLVQITNSRFAIACMGCVVLSVVGILVSVSIRKTPPAGSTQKASVFFFRDIWRTLHSIRADKDLLLAVFASAYFMLLGAFVYANLLPYGMEYLGLDGTRSAYLFLVAALGIGVGAFFSGKLSGRNIEFGIVPLGALGLAVSSLSLGLFTPGLYGVIAWVFILGLGGGMFIVPIHAFIQFRSPAQRRGEVLAASNWVGWVGVLAASGLVYLFSEVLGLLPAHGFILLGLLTLALTIVAIVLLPDFLIRFLSLLITKVFYRIKVYGQENIPVDGGALVVCNHVSWIDAILLGATQQRRLRFIMERELYDVLWYRWFFRLLGVIPISTHDSPKKILRSFRDARKAIDDGFIVCIFAEGAITRNGLIRKFRAGFERIIKGSDRPVIPAYLGGVWGSIFSYYHGRILSTLPSALQYPVSVHFGEPLSSDATAPQMRQKVQELSCDYYDSQKSPNRSLARIFVRAARRHRRRRCICDSTGRKLNYGKTLTSAIALSRQVDRLAEGQGKVGILLPPSAAGVLANIAVTMSGRISVNLNYVASEEARRSAINQCRLTCIISSRAFAEKIEHIDALPGVLYLEDIVKEITPGDKIRAWLKSYLVPSRMLTRSHRFCGDSIATIIFSSGSTGTPKGVMLSHHNIISNAEALRKVIKVDQRDNLCVVLPFFHSFGFTCGLWLPLLTDISASYIANPLDGVVVGKMARENRSTIMFAPPTFLMSYLRRTPPEDLASLRFAAAGAEKLKARLAEAFFNRFNRLLYEGYGCTELSPVITLNLPDVEIGGGRHIGHKPGTVGHPLSGIVVRITHPDTGQDLAVGEEGLILVKGPNVMAGYLNMPEESAEVLDDGWYNTGDIGSVDGDGFLTITDRLSRFSKIGGEMVGHLGIEHVYMEGLKTHDQLVAVTSVPDAKRGEELVVLYLPEAGEPKKLHKIISNSDLPNMWKPRKDSYVRVDSMPILGSGKLDLKKLKSIALAAKGGHAS